MAISDMVVGKLTTLYLAAIVAIKAYGLMTGRNYGGVLVLALSTAAIVIMLVGALTWDVSRKAAYTVARAAAASSSQAEDVHGMCRGGICWHGVAVKSPASRVRFRLPQNQLPNLL